MFKIKYKGKWHDVEGVDKCDEGVSYQAKGIKRKIKAADVEDVDLKKEGHEILNPDGSVTRGPGKEPLMKPIAKSLRERWKLLKAKLKNEDSILSLIDNPSKEKENESAPAGAGDSNQDGMVPESGGDDVEADNQQVPQVGQNAATEDGPDDGSSAGGDDEHASDAQEAGAQQVEQEQQQEPEQDAQPEDDYNEEELINHLKEQGYSPSEIAHIVHGHSPAPASKEQMSEMSHEQSMGHKDEKHDVALDFHEKEHELKHHHTKRTLDLEHEMDRREKELRLKYLEQELQAKIDNLKAKKG